MKFLTLDLLAFGPFTKTKLDFTDGATGLDQTGLHLIYGPNEAGKSSALRAITALLYGIEQKTNDNFLHSYQELRIGGTLLHSDTRRLEFWRKKGLKNTLLDAAGQPIAAEVLKHFLGDASQEFFHALFGLDHVRLREGGKEIMAGGGQVGTALFAAGTGLTGLRQTAATLQSEADALFRFRAQKPRINELIQQCRELRKVRDNQILRGAVWQDHEQKLQQAKTQLTELNTLIQNRRTEQVRLERIGQALPQIAQKTALQTALTNLTDAILLPVDFPTRRTGAMERLASARRELESVEQILAQLNAEAQNLVVNNDLLHLRPEIERLFKIAGATEKADTDLINLRIRAREQEASAHKALQELRTDLTLHQAESELRLSKARRDGIRELGNQYSALVERQTKATAVKAELQAKFSKQRKMLAELDIAANTADLKRTCERAQRGLDIESQLVAVRKNLALEQTQVAIALQRLPGWRLDLQSLELLALPTRETIDSFNDAFSDLDSQHKNITRQLDTANLALAEAVRQLDTLRLEIKVPAEEDVYVARRRRDIGWNLVRQAWQTPTQRNLVAEQAFTAESSLALAYEQAVLTADEIADRLRREAGRVQQQAQARANVTFHQSEASNLQQTQAAIAKTRIEWEQAWQALWEPLGIICRSPKEMRSWLVSAEVLRTQAAQLRKYQAEETDLAARRESLLADLNSQLRTFTTQQPAGKQGLEYSIYQAQAIINQHEKLRQQRHQLETSLTDLEYNQQQAEQVVMAASADLRTWQNRWANAVGILGLEPDASPSQANAALGKIEDLFDSLSQAAGFLQRIRDIERDRIQFEGTVKNLCTQIAADLQNQPALLAIAIVSARLQEAQENFAQRNTLTKQIASEQKRIEKIRLNHQLAKDQISVCLQEAQCTQVEALPAKEAASQQRRELETALAACDGRLRELSGGKGEELLLTEATQVDADTLPGQIDAMQLEIQNLEQQRSELNQTVGKEQSELAHMDGRSDAAEQAEKIEYALAELRSSGEQYLKLRLASALLEQQIETYRQQHQTPLLNRAGEFFSQLTVGAFTGLEASFEEDDRQILRGIRANATAVTVEGMSDGTRDQLFLALRLASIESYLERAEPIPLIVDDILIHYDDARSSATLQTLANFSTRTQVIMFTHHQHLLNMARQTLASGKLWIHELR